MASIEWEGKGYSVQLCGRRPRKLPLLGKKISIHYGYVSIILISANRYWGFSQHVLCCSAARYRTKAIFALYIVPYIKASFLGRVGINFSLIIIKYRISNLRRILHTRVWGDLASPLIFHLSIKNSLIALWANCVGGFIHIIIKKLIDLFSRTH